MVIKIIFRFKKKQEKCVELTPEILGKLQEKSLKMFKYFKNFCEEHNLRFYVCGGACIGAIRHSGFVPWDDDIDVFMPRDDYEKLYNLWKKHADTDKYLCLKTTNNKNFTGNIFITIIDVNSTLIKPYQKNLDIPLGIPMDVLPLDGYAPGFFKRKLQIFWSLVYSLYCSKYVPVKHGKIIALVSKFLLLIPDKFKTKIWKFAQKQMTKYKFSESNYITELCSGPKYMRNKYPKHMFQEPDYKKFEDCIIPVPSDWDLYLKMVFGDYMKLPEKKNQKPHHDIIFLDLDNSYKIYNKKHKKI